jgi:hypothetical protein
MCAACFRAVKPWLAHSSSPGRSIGADTIVSTGGWQEFPVYSGLDAATNADNFSLQSQLLG